MQYLDLTLPTPAENLALDEALLDEAEASETPAETLRLWEPWRPMVVVGRSSQFHVEVRLDACRAGGIPVLRRCSGGAAIVAGPGCLMYALVLSYRLRPQLRSLGEAHRWVLGKLTGAFREFAAGVECKGTSDLAIGGRKFSGNSARLRRNHLLYHGTLLYDFPLELVERCLAMPPRMPDYREDRRHESFLTNLPLSRETIRKALVDAFAADESRTSWPEHRTAQLVVERYSLPEWQMQDWRQSE
ncbi:MAG: lipoate--protein ligase family protein [Thermoguttaceae bacterium]|jgi:lipoate-protein ligase A